jgi:hypothetical protein
MQACKVETQVAGFFKFEKFKTDSAGRELPGSREIAVDWFENLILDQGLDFLASGVSYLNSCQVGTGSTAPAAGQTALTTHIAGTSTLTGVGVTTTAESAPYYVAHTLKYFFGEGVAAGNLAEVGVGTATSGTTLFSRSLIKDTFGAPTTITVLPDESLEVTYQLRYYAPASDVSGSVVATGNIGGTYDYILRAAKVTTVDPGNGWTLPRSQGLGTTNSVGFFATASDIAAITSAPAFSNPINPPVASAYVGGNFYIDWTITATAAQANIAGGVRSFLVNIGIGTYQIQFDPKIPKTLTDVVQFVIRLSWARRP